jgi:hypothetical protein
MTTFRGQSGSPVIYDGKLIAVHIKSGKADGKNRVLYNVGRLVTLDMIANLQEWAKLMGADPFQLNTENLCHHLQEAIGIKRVASDAFKIKPYIPKGLRFDA